MKYLPVILIAISSCKLTEKNIAGDYRHYFNFENSTYLKINEDRTYSFNLQAGLIFFQSEGTWTLANDTLFLHNKDTTDNTFMANEKFLIKKRKLFEVLDNKTTALKLRKK